MSIDERAQERVELGRVIREAMDNVGLPNVGSLLAVGAVLDAVQEWLAARSPSPDASNPLVEALEWIADGERADTDGSFEALYEWAVEAHDRARAALAAHRPERQWRIVDRFGRNCGDCHSYAERPHEDDLAHLAATLPGHAPYKVQVREVGPWQDVTDGPEPHRVETYQPVPREPGEHERLIAESVERAPHDTASRAFRPGEGGGDV